MKFSHKLGAALLAVTAVLGLGLGNANAADLPDEA